MQTSIHGSGGLRVNKHFHSPRRVTFKLTAQLCSAAGNVQKNTSQTFVEKSQIYVGTGWSLEAIGNGRRSQVQRLRQQTTAHTSSIV